MGQSVKICYYKAVYVAEVLFAFLWNQIVPHYWLACFSIPMRMSLYISSLRRGKTAS